MRTVCYACNCEFCEDAETCGGRGIGRYSVPVEDD